MKKYVDEKQLTTCIDDTKLEIKSELDKKIDKENIPFSFGIDAQGNYGYFKAGADTVTPFKTFIKIGTIDIARAYNSIDVSKYPTLTLSDIFLVPTAIQISQNRGTTGTEIAKFERTLSNGIFTIRREAFDGNITVTLPCDVYVFI